MSKKRKRRKKTTIPDSPESPREETDEEKIASEPDGHDDGTDADGDGDVTPSDGATRSVAVTDTLLGRLWQSPVYNGIMRIYEIVTYSVGGGLCVAMISARMGGSPIVQWIFGIIAMLAIVLSKTVFSGELGSIYDEALEKVEEDRRRDQEELANGNFDGVPKAMQDLIPYPTDEDYQRIHDEAEHQKELLHEWKNRKRKKGNDDDKDGGSE